MARRLADKKNDEYTKTMTNQQEDDKLQEDSNTVTERCKNKTE